MIHLKTSSAASVRNAMISCNIRARDLLGLISISHDFILCAFTDFDY